MDNGFDGIKELQIGSSHVGKDVEVEVANCLQ